MAEQMGPKRYLLAASMLFPLLLNLWKLIFLGYGWGEALSLLVVDGLATALFAALILLNPLEHFLGYSALYAAFIIAFLVHSPPLGFWDWFGTLVVLVLVWPLIPRLYLVAGLALGAFFVALLIVRVALPLHYRDEAAEHFKQRNYPNLTAVTFMDKLADHSVFALGREKFRWYLAPEANTWSQMRKMRRLHASIWRQYKAIGVYYVNWRMAGARVPSRPKGRVTATVVGEPIGIVKDESRITPEMTRAKMEMFESLPAIRVYITPFDLQMVQDANGLWRVADFPESVTLSIKP